MKKVYQIALHVTDFRSILSPPTRTHVMKTTKKTLQYYSGDIATGNAPSPAGTWDGNIFICENGICWSFDAEEGNPREDGSGVHYLTLNSKP